MNAVYRCYVEKKPGFDGERVALLRALRETLGIRALAGLRILNRYDADSLDKASYEAAKTTVFSQPQCDFFYDETFPPSPEPQHLLVVQALPGQFDQRADSCCQCIQMLTGKNRPNVAYSKVYVLLGDLSPQEIDRISSYLMNPVDSRLVGSEKPLALHQSYPAPPPVASLSGFTALDAQCLSALIPQYGLAMDAGDLGFLQTYFRDEERRDPTLTELRLVDTYWSDHCRHTTFGTHIDSAQLLDPAVAAAYDRYLSARQEVYGAEKAALRPQTLMDLATIGAKTLKKRGLLQKLDESEEINACSVHVTATVDGEAQDWLLMFKNETHNHPTEIEPFGGAATCIGGAIRDPLSGRSYVYQGMRISGCGDPTVPLENTLSGKLPQQKLCTTAAAGYSSYGNQIGLATGIVHELYHPGYVAKHLELGAVVGAAPAKNVVRLTPQPGDQVILLGGRTGRDGIGGATGSSKTHTKESLDSCAAEVQKGNAPEERKIQRLFRNPLVAQKIKRCNDFGAGGVSVAIGELAPGLSINLDAVRKKYDGLDGTELAISESQERMAVVVAPEDVAFFIAAAEGENLEAYLAAEVTATPRLVLTWNGEKIADLSRAFLDSNGAVKHTAVEVPLLPKPVRPAPKGRSLREKFESLLSDLAFASQRGLNERFDPTIGSSSILVPFGGAYQRTPTQVMAARLPVGPGHTTDACSVMAWGGDPFELAQNPFEGARHAVVDSLCKLVAAGCNPDEAYLSFQEYFEKLRNEPLRWGKPFAALLGALDAQLGLEHAAIGGKDSMSGSFLDLDVPPTLISFAVSPAGDAEIRSTEWKAPGHPVYLFAPKSEEYADVKALWQDFYRLSGAGTVLSAWAVGSGGIAEGLLKMSFGNALGFIAADDLDPDALFTPRYGALIAECDSEVPSGLLLGFTASEGTGFTIAGERIVGDLVSLWETPLSEIYPTKPPETDLPQPPVSPLSWDRRSPLVCKHKVARPHVTIPVFPGTNCEYDTANALLKAGLDPEILVVRNLTPDLLRQSVEALSAAISRSQIVVLPGGFSGGDEPDGSAKFICALLRNPRLTQSIQDLLTHRDGLMLGICNGFQALIKLGLVPYGEIRPIDDSCPTLTHNLIGRHQSRYVTTRVSSVQSPWMLRCQVGDLHTVPISHGEGRFVCQPEELQRLIAAGQIATQYVDLSGAPSMDITVNPNGSACCVEGLFSPDGRVFGKMAHSERRGDFVAKNIPGNLFQPIFEGGAAYYA